jgi:hypothetical protein
MTTTYYYQTETMTIAYQTPEDIIPFLIQRPELVPSYINTMERLARTMHAWGDYRGMREIYNILVDVLIGVKKAQGENILE